MRQLNGLIILILEYLGGIESYFEKSNNRNISQILEYLGGIESLFLSIVWLL